MESACEIKKSICGSWVLWAELSPHRTPQIHMLKPYPLVSQNVTVFKGRDFQEVIELQLGHLGGP